MRRLRSIIWPFWPYDRFLCSQSLHGFVRNQEKVSQAYEMSVSKKRVHTKRTTFHFFVRNGERFPLLLETNNAFRIVTQTYFNSEHTIDFCAVKVFMVLLETKKEFLKLTKRPWVRNDYIPNEQCFIFCWKRTKFPFVVRNERRFKNLHGVIGNKERFSDKKFSTLLPINSLKFWSFW